ncbi:MAG: hypothetical protein U0R49_00515 [Fimbriimonadales bacterium]
MDEQQPIANETPPAADPPPRKKRRIRWGIITPLIIVIALLLTIGKGYLGKLPALFEIYCTPKRKFSSESSLENLKFVGTALSLYLESNDCYPPAEKWVDEIEKYLHVADMDDKESRKKLRAPEFADSKNEYGFAFNAELSRKWRDEVKDPASVPAIYDSTKTERNAFDPKPLESMPTPEREGGNAIVFADGHAAPAPKKN